MSREKHPSRRAWAFGPGIVYLLGSIGPNDLIANSAAGAAYGYSLLWALIVGYGLCYFIAEASSRYVLATGESIMEGYERLGPPVVLALAAAIFVRRHLNNLAMTLLLGASVHLLVPLSTPWSSTIWSVISLVLAFTLMFRGGYKGVEDVCRPLLALLVGSLVIIAVLARPSPGEMLRGLLIPTYPDNVGIYSYIMVLMAVAGTSVGSINHLKYPAYVFEKGWRSPEDFRKQRADLALSVFGQFFVSFLIQVAAAATLYGQGVDVTSLEDLARVFSGPLGETGRILLGVGMWVAVITSYLGSNTGYGLIVADTYERFTSRNKGERPSVSRDEVRGHVYRVLLVLFCLPPLYALFTSWKPIWIAVATSAMFMVLTPLMMTGLLLLTNKRSLMRDRVNGWTSRIALGLAIAIAAYLTYESVIELFGGD